MEIIYFVAGFSAGAVFTALAGMFYIKRKIRSQLGMVEDQMDSLMDTTEGLSEEIEAEELDIETDGGD